MCIGFILALVTYDKFGKFIKEAVENTLKASTARTTVNSETPNNSTKDDGSRRASAMTTTTFTDASSVQQDSILHILAGKQLLVNADMILNAPIANLAHDLPGMHSSLS